MLSQSAPFLSTGLGNSRSTSALKDLRRLPTLICSFVAQKRAPAIVIPHNPRKPVGHFSGAIVGTTVCSPGGGTPRDSTLAALRVYLASYMANCFLFPLGDVLAEWWDDVSWVLLDSAKGRDLATETVVVN